MIRDAKNDIATAIQHHQQVRTTLRTDCELLLSLLSSHPSAIIPHTQRALAFIHLARTEIVWFVKHINSAPQQRNNTTAQADESVSVLLHGVMSLSELMIRSKKLIAAYYRDCIDGVDSAQMRVALDKLLNSNQVNPTLRTQLEALASSLSRSVDESFESIRLNWYRLYTLINNHPPAGLPANITHPLSLTMMTVIAHSRHVDSLEVEIKTHSSFQQLCWAKQELKRAHPTVRQRSVRLHSPLRADVPLVFA